MDGDVGMCESDVVGKRGKKRSEDVDISVTVKAHASGGVRRASILFFIHLSQLAGLSSSFGRRFSPDMDWRCSIFLDFLGIFVRWLGPDCASASETSERILFSRVSISVCMLSLVFLAHLGLRTTTCLLFYMSLLVPFCTGHVLSSGAGVVYGVCMLLLLFMCLVFGRAAAFTNGVGDTRVSKFLASVSGIIDRTVMSPFRNIWSYCSFGDAAVRSGHRDGTLGALGLSAYLLFTFMWLVLSLCSFRCGSFWSLCGMLLFCVTGTVFVVSRLKRVRASKGDLRYLSCSVYELYAKLVYAPAIYGLEFAKCGGSESPRHIVLSVYVIAFCILLPLFEKLVVTLELRRLSVSLSDNDYYSFIAKGGERYCWSFSGVKRDRYWWPFTDSFVHIFYCFMLNAGLDVANLIVSLFFVIVVIWARPYVHDSVWLMNIGEYVGIAVVSLMSVLHSRCVVWDGNTEVLSLLIIDIVVGFSIVHSTMSFDSNERRFTHAYKASVKDDNHLKSKDREDDELGTERTLLGLSAEVKLESSDDVPVFMPEEAFIETYSGPSHDISGELDRIYRDESDIAKYIASVRYGMRDEIVEFHISQGVDPYVFDYSICDRDLPQNVLVQRVEYDVRLLTRRVHSLRLPISAVFLVICVNTLFDTGVSG